MASATTLTTLLVSPSDLKRARRDVEALDNFLHQAGLRQGGKAVKMPATSRVVTELADESGLNLLKKVDRDRLLKFLTLLIEKAPVLHMSFASEPSTAFLNKLILWLRENIHPQVVVSVGLQPSIAAGCVVRTANRQIDMSLRNSFDKQANAFIESLRPPTQQGTAAPVAPVSSASIAPAATPQLARSAPSTSVTPVAKAQSVKVAVK